MHSTWPLYLRVFLALHVAAGVIAFVCAPVALLTAKGGRAHRRWGKIYFWAMAGVAATALVLAIMLPILFLALVAVFSFYAAFAGYRVLSLKNLSRGGRAHTADWIAALVTFTSSAALAGIGAFGPGMMRGMSPVVPIIFGCIGMALGGRSILLFARPPAEKQFWWYEHMQGMLASYIAACSAFSVVNLGRWFGNAWWVWLWPTIIGVPGIIIWVRYYRIKFAPKRTKTPQPEKLTT